MWNSFVFKNEGYLMKILHTENYKFLLCNIEKIWMEELSGDQIAERCKELNPTISTETETYVNTVMAMVNDISEKTDFITHRNNGDVILECRTKLVGVPFRFTLHLQLGDSKEFCKDITVPLMQTIQVLESKQKHLLNLMKIKDEKIEQQMFLNNELYNTCGKFQKFDKTSFFTNIPDSLCFQVLSKPGFKEAFSGKYGFPESVKSTPKRKRIELVESLTMRVIKQRKN